MRSAGSSRTRLLGDALLERNAGRRWEKRRPPGVVPGIVPVLAVIAAVAYASFLLEHLLSPDLDVIDGYASELSAIDQPYHVVYSTGDLITGVLAIIVALSGLLLLTRRPWATTGWTFLLLFGMGAIGDATFPLDCAPSLDTRCALLERAGKVSFSHQFHAVTSSAVIVFGVLALFTLSIAARRYGWWPALARWGWFLAVLEAGTGIATLGLMLVGHWLGFVQRIQISILCLALLVIGWALFADRRHVVLPGTAFLPAPRDGDPGGPRDTGDPGDPYGSGEVPRPRAEAVRGGDGARGPCDTWRGRGAAP